jgi:hypothetical protein
MLHTYGCRVTLAARTACACACACACVSVCTCVRPVVGRGLQGSGCYCLAAARTQATLLVERGWLCVPVAPWHACALRGVVCTTGFDSTVCTRTPPATALLLRWAVSSLYAVLTAVARQCTLSRCAAYRHLSLGAQHAFPCRAPYGSVRARRVCTLCQQHWARVGIVETPSRVYSQAFGVRCVCGLRARVLVPLLLSCVAACIACIAFVASCPCARVVCACVCVCGFCAVRVRRAELACSSEFVDAVMCTCRQCVCVVVCVCVCCGVCVWVGACVPASVCLKPTWAVATHGRPGGLHAVHVRSSTC